MPAGMAEKALSYDNRLRRGGDFRRAYKEGAKAACAEMAVYARENGLGGNRYGFSVSKKVGCAVVRNKVRRRLKEVTRREISWERMETPGAGVVSLWGYDIVIVARPAVTGASYKKIASEMKRLSLKLASDKPYKKQARGLARRPGKGN